MRGFRDVNIYGSMGILMRNDIDFSMSDYVKSSNLFTQILTNNGKGGLTFGIFYDIGIAGSRNPNASSASGTEAGTFSSGNYGAMSGIGHKIGYVHENIQANLSVGYSLLYPGYLQTSVVNNDGVVVYLTVRCVW